MASSTITRPGSSNAFRFFDLPGEIRNMIYRKLFRLKSYEEVPRSAQFLRTCRRAHSEATRVLYEENLIRMFVSSGQLRVFDTPMCLGDFNLHGIRRLEINVEVVLKFWNFEEPDGRKLRENIMDICSCLSQHHHLSRLILRIDCSVPWPDGTTHRNRLTEAMILSQFFVVGHIPVVKIYASTNDFFNTKLIEAMRSIDHFV